MTVTVVAAIIRQNGKILITRRFDNVHLPGFWEFPGGKVEPGEPFDAALSREILEELGVEIAVHDKFFEVEHHYPTKSIRLHFFNCSIIGGTARPLDVADLAWVEPRDLDQYEFPAADHELVARLRRESFG